MQNTVKFDKPHDENFQKTESGDTNEIMRNQGLKEDRKTRKDFFAVNWRSKISPRK